MKRNLVLFLILSLTLGLHAQPQPRAASMEVKEFKLENGLTVILNEDPYATKVFGAVAVNAGSKYDPKDVTGLAHYLEHMCFKGTQTMGTTNYAAEKPLLDSITMLYDKLAQTTDEKARTAIQKEINAVSVRAAQFAIPNEMDRMLKSFGSTGLNAFTSFEEVVYHNAFPAHQMEKWLDVYAHRFQDPVFRLFQPELEVVYEEKNRGSDNFATKLMEAYLEGVFKNHPYGTQSTIGSTEHLKNPPLRKMQEYYNTYFVANNMALILTGNFRSDEVIPLIREKFGKWRSGKVPTFPEYKEAPFNGRELKSVRLTPVKIGIMGFRTFPVGNKDQYAMAVVSQLLNNENETGLLDDLRSAGKLQFGQAINMELGDHGIFGVLYVPKIIGQSLDNAEQKVLAALDSLKAGKFDDKMFEAARNNLLLDYYREMENGQQRALAMVNTFIQNEKWQEILDYPNRIMALKKEDVLAAANKYFGPNYFNLQSKMGFPKKDKLQKPGFEPVAPKSGVQSEYAMHLDKVPAGKPAGKPFIDFQEDVTRIALRENVKLYHTQNPLNDLFTLKLKYKATSYSLPGLEDAVNYMTYLGGGDMSAKDFKRRMNELGLTYSLTEEPGALVVELSGLEQNLEAGLRMIEKLMTQPQADQEKYKLYLSDMKTNRKLETGDASSTAEILNQYLRLGANSPYLRRKTLAELNKTKPEDLLALFKQAISAPLSVHYVGKTKPEQVRYLVNNATFTALVKSGTASPKPAELYAPREAYKTPVFVVMNRKDARQSHLYYYADAGAFSQDAQPIQKAFNSYFGGDMSSLAFQEIREFRSLAYSVRLYVMSEPSTGYHNTFMGYIGCQDDKTKDALQASMDLIKKMPEKPERMEGIKNGLVDASYAAKPGFRSLSEVLENYEEQGLTQDPNALNLPMYSRLNFDDIRKYYQAKVQNLPVSIAIVGNAKHIPLDELKKMGQVKIVKEKDILKK